MLPNENRLHALDAVRSFALLLGIVLHSTMSFMPGLAASGWPIVDRSQSAALQLMFFVIHIFRMTLFFVIAGFFAHLLFHSRGVRAFVKDRTRRVLVPFIIAWVVLVPIVGAIIYWAAIERSGGGPLPPQPAGVPLMHLWFLYVLMLFYVCVALLRPALVKPLEGNALARIDRAVAWLVGQPLAPFLLAIPVGACLYSYENWIAFAGIPTPDMSLIPNLPAFVGYGVAFSFGWLLHRQPAVLSHLGRIWYAHLGIAVVLTITALAILGVDGKTIPGARHIAYIVAYTTASWSWTFALIGASMHFLSKSRPVVRYLADSSYWLYLVHLPVVFALQQTMASWNLHWSIKYPLILATAMIILLSSYHWLVRSTFIGAWLNGKRYPRSASTASAPILARAPTAGDSA